MDSDALAHLDRTHVWHPFTQQRGWEAERPVLIERGAGCTLYDTDGAGMGDGAEVELDVGAVEVGETETISVDSEQVELTPVSVGNPHAVIRREPERAELLRLGPLVESHERFPERTNVQLVRVDNPNELTVGVWERGAGETLSSGTSAVAASAAAVANGWCESPVTVHLAGGDLLVELADGEARLTGPAEEICLVELAEEFVL